MNVSRDRLHLFAVAIALASWGCNDPPREEESTNVPPAIQISGENSVTVTEDTIVAGPIVSGELRAERQATVRAELSGSMTAVNVEEGQPVRQGTVLGRIEAAALEDTRQSAETAVRAAEGQLAVARREADRTRQLVAAGALAQRDLDLAEGNVSAAEGQLAQARAQLVTAQKQLADAVVRAPLTGIVAERFVGAGDVVTPGTELFTIIDPSSLRLEASVPSGDLGTLRIGLPVLFDVQGFDQTFTGEIERISPIADPVTRQVSIFVTLPNPDGRIVAGLYAEGRVVEESATGLVVDSDAVNIDGEAPWVLRVRDGITERVEVRLGVRDPLTDRVELTAGVNAGDVLLRGPAQSIAPGTRVTLESPVSRLDGRQLSPVSNVSGTFSQARHVHL